MSRPSCLAEPDLLSAAMGESMTTARKHLAGCPFCGRRLRRLAGEVASCAASPPACRSCPHPFLLLRPIVLSDRWPCRVGRGTRPTGRGGFRSSTHPTPKIVKQTRPSCLHQSSRG